MMRYYRAIYIFSFLLIFSCKKSDDSPVPVVAANLTVLTATVDGKNNPAGSHSGTSLNPEIRFTFSEAITPDGLDKNVSFTSASDVKVPFNVAVENTKELVIKPVAALAPLTTFRLNLSNIRSLKGGVLKTPSSIKLSTTFDPADKFPRVSDEQLMDLVQKQTFKYFWDFGHPISGLSRERESSGDLVTSGGSGFGVMAIVVGVHRQFVTRAEALTRVQKIVGFLKNNAQRFHGAFPHWLNGATGAAIAFSPKDNGADLVETSYLMQGLLTARQYFNGTDPAESALRADINAIWDAVDWNWFRKNNENTLYWHWSPDQNWAINQQVQGWNESLITYVMAASSNTSAIPKAVYDNGWARNGSMRNGNIYLGQQLALGPELGGPLFFAHYSFLGINPRGLTDAYANYETQNIAHTLINYNYCKANPKAYVGYSENCWGLTASDDIIGYRVHEPANDNGVISPTAALSSFPYTPKESLAALNFFYYKLGDRIFKEYGFTDAFSLTEPWFATSFLAIDQGPIIIMMENHRSGLPWKLFMSCPEVKRGMNTLGFQSPNL